jgi:beta-glucuronidase
VSFRKALIAVLALMTLAALLPNAASAQSTATATATATAPATPYSPPYGLPYQVLTPYTATPPTKGALASDGQTNRYLLGGTWLYEADPGNIGVTDGWQNQTSTTGWEELTVPNSYNAGDLSQTSMNGYTGWYRRDFTLPKNVFPKSVPKWAQSWTVEFESVNYQATVWLNGHELGTHSGAYLPFEFPLKDLKSGTNRLVIRVNNQRTATDFPPGPGGGWWNFGGILDAVYLEPVARAELQTALIRPILKCPTCSATIDEQATVRNLSPRNESVKLTGVYGSAKLDFGSATIRPGATWSPTAAVTIAHPRLWAPGSPNLYNASLTLAGANVGKKQGPTLGGYSYESGIREITVQNGLLYLNGRQLHLRGVNLHEQTTTTGAALSVPQQQQLISWVQELGGTVIRAHYPLDPEMEEMADKDGILLWSEVPVYQLSAQDLASVSVRNAAVALLKNNIETNQNHPSILLWSIGNELPTPPTGPEATYIKEAAAAARATDPTRPVAMAISNWPGVACQTAYAPLDVLGINEYFSWFDTGGGTNDDRQALEPYLQSVRQCYPNQALMITEVGYGGNRNGPVEVRGTYQYQSNMLAYTLGVFNQLPWLSGALWFPMQDFAVEPGYDGSDPLGQPPYVDKGVLDQYGNPKPAFAVMAQMYKATVQITPLK